ncbi:hypothetical protein PoB_007454200 [Plakobranchus ocellatus]|uniref:Uncharacterized protein n=1 Tax=Plakobranchus ocellatus TaxID=259542 RepID=A0AAV4DVK4_9GAST|nr:hypothetical protein PoB_007454200 [Plakobranchus ocellatus]
MSTYQLRLFHRSRTARWRRDSKVYADFQGKFVVPMVTKAPGKKGLAGKTLTWISGFKTSVQNIIWHEKGWDGWREQAPILNSQILYSARHCYRQISADSRVSSLAVGPPTPSQ